MLALNEYDPLVRNKLLEDYIGGMIEQDKNALVNFYEMTKEAIYGFILSIIVNKDDADDIFQEVYIKIYENSSKYKKEGKPLAWIMTITKNLCYEKIRKRKNHVDIEEVYNVGFDDKDSKRIEDRMILNMLLNKITEEERTIIMLHIVSGMKYREISKTLNLSLSTVLSKYHRALKKMKNYLKEDMK
ncbi:MAG TPA: RNA polymerase sigma factor [Candidatus Coprovivens excrementavium]|nr:RNA polymerase sigma factor [Candidatus Coprovivens excrementavium]